MKTLRQIAEEIVEAGKRPCAKPQMIPCPDGKPGCLVLHSKPCGQCIPCRARPSDKIAALLLEIAECFEKSKLGNHAYNGGCPDATNPSRRGRNCVACQVLMRFDAALAKLDEEAGA